MRRPTDFGRRRSEHPRSSIGEVVYQRLLADLVTATVEPGERLTVDALARSLGVSQTPVREALSRLEADALVIKTHLRGYRAAPELTEHEFRDMFEVRVLLEPYAARQAAHHGSIGQLEEMQAISEQMWDCLKDADLSGRHSEVALLDGALHDLVAAASGNALIRSHLVRRHASLHVYRLRRTHTAVEAAVREHQAVIDAVRRRDSRSAEAAMRSHLERAYQRIFGDFHGHGGEPAPPLP